MKKLTTKTAATSTVLFMSLLAMSLPVFAAADTTVIDAAKADLLAYAAALLALGVAVWAALKVVRMFGGK